MKRILLILLLVVMPVVSAETIKINGTQYYEKLDGSTTETPSFITQTPSGYRIDWRGMYYFTIWDGINAYDTFNYPNGTFVSPWVFPKIEYWRTTGSKRWVEVIPINNTFEQSGNQIIRRMTMGDNSKFNITYTSSDKIKYTWNFTAGANQNYSIVLRLDSSASEDINLASKRYTPGWFSNRTFYSFSDVQEPYASNVSSWYEAGNRKFFQRIILGQQAIGNSTEIDPSIQFNGSTSPAWVNVSLIDTTINYGTNNIELRQQVDNYTSYWRGDGTAKDDNRTSANDGTLVGNANATSPGKFGNFAFGFDGNGDYVNVPTTQNLNFGIDDFTITLQFKQTARTTTYPTMISKGDIGAGEWMLRDSGDGKIQFYGNTAAINLITTTITNFNEWYFLAVTRIGNNSYLYLNGTSQSVDSTSYANLTNSISLQIGSGNLAANRWFNGSIDDIKIYHRGLSGDEIKLIQNQSKYLSGYIIANATFESGRQGSISNSTILNLDANNLYFINSSTENNTYTSDCSSSCANITNYSITSKAQTQWLRINISGNGTSTPEINQIVIYDEAVSGGGAVSNLTRSYVQPARQYRRDNQ